MSHSPQDADDRSRGSSLDDAIAEYHRRVDSEGPVHRPTIRSEMLEELPQQQEELLAYFADEDFAQAMAVTFGDNHQVSSSGERVIRYLGGYALLEMIGAGGMGDVYRARQLSTKRLVAVKLMRFTASRERFQREIEVAAKLKHDNIVTLYEAGEDNGQQFYSMAYVDGGSLANRADRSPRQVAEWGLKLASALDYAHNQDVLHRDIKPENILLDKQGNPLITDFGLAKLLEASHDAAATKGPLGTFQYMSPEQAAGENDRLCAASDVYSLGATLYELLAGHPPIQGPNLQQIIANIQSHQPESPRIANREVPTDLANICLKCLQKHPKDRYQTAAQLADHLRLFLDNKPVPVKPIRFWTRISRWIRREPAIALLSAAIVLVLVVGVAVTAFFAIRTEQKAYEAERNRKRAEQSEQHAINEQERLQRLRYARNLKSASDAITKLDYDEAIAFLKKIPKVQYGCDTALVAGRLERFSGEHDIPRADSGQGSSKKSSCTAVALACGQPIMACGTDTGLVCAWVSPTQERLDPFLGHDGAVQCLALSQCGRYLVSGGHDESVRVWSIKEERAIFSGKLSSAVTAVAVSPDSDATQIAAGGSDGEIVVWNRAEGVELESFDTGSVPISHIAFAPTTFRKPRFDRDDYPTDIYLGVGYEDGRISLWRQRGRIITSNPRAHLGKVFQLEFFDGVLQSCAADGQVRWWFFDRVARLDQGIPQKMVGMGGLRSGATGPTGRESIWVGEDAAQLRCGIENAHRVVIHSPITGEQTLLPRLSNIITADIQSPPPVVSTASNDYVFLVGFGDKVYERLKFDYWVSFSLNATDIPVALPAIEMAYDATDKLVAFDRSQVEGTDGLNLSGGRHRIPVAGVERAAVSHDGRFLATGSVGEIVRIWDVSALWDASPGKPDHTFNVHGPALAGADERAITKLCFTRDDRYVVVGSESNHLSIWDVASGRRVLSAPLEARVVSVDSTNSSDRLLLTFADRVQVRELTTLDLIREFTSTGSITCAFFDRQCERVAAACGDATVRIWRTHDGKLLHVLDHKNVSALRFHPVEDRLVTVGNSLVIWDATLGEELWRTRLLDQARPPNWVNFKKPETGNRRAFSIVTTAKHPGYEETQMQFWNTAPGWSMLDKLTAATDQETIAIQSTLSTESIDSLCDMLHDPEKRDAAKMELMDRDAEALRPLLKRRLAPDVMYAVGIEHMYGMLAIDDIIIHHGPPAIPIITEYVDELEVPAPLDNEPTRDGHTVGTYMYTRKLAGDIVDAIQQ